MENTTLIFIPDISGFTNFVNKTEISHSNHIISELIEIIIDSNELDLKVSEIEGDAVLFYKTGTLPSFEQLLLQTKKMFVNFHHHIKIIESTNVCQCGACTSVSDLSLKFITHTGELQLTKINKFEKLIGRDIILAHRLLKNNIGSKEYLLVTKDSLLEEHSNLAQEKWIEFCEIEEELEQFGRVQISYVVLTPLLQQVPQPEVPKIDIVTSPTQSFTVLINAPRNKVHTALITPELKPNFTDGLKDIVSDSKINRVQKGHLCVFDEVTIQFTTLENSVTDEYIKYVEKAETSTGITFITEYLLAEKAGETELKMEVFPITEDDTSRQKVLSALSGFGTVLDNFKKYCEGLDTI